MRPGGGGEGGRGHVAPTQASVLTKSTSSYMTGKMVFLSPSAVHSSFIQYRELMYFCVMTGMKAAHSCSPVPISMAQCSHAGVIADLFRRENVPGEHTR